MRLRQIIDEVMYEIRELSGQEYVDEYATKKAESIPTETAHMPEAAGGTSGTATSRRRPGAARPRSSERARADAGGGTSCQVTNPAAIAAQEA